MPSLKELQSKLDSVNEQIDAEWARLRQEALTTAKALVERYEITAGEMFDVPAKRAVAAKYQDPATGQTWTGRGKEPAWIRRKNRELFKIHV